MTWQNVQYCILHAARDAGAAAITPNNTFAANGAAYLVDDRAGSISTFTAAATDHYYDIDRGAGTLEELARLIVPVGHNWNGENVRIQTDSDPGFATDLTEILAKTAISSAGIIDLAMAGGTEAQRKYRYVRVDDDDAASWNPQTPQLILTRTRTLDRGPEQGWVDMLQHNTQDFALESGAIASLALGADRRLFELTYRDVVLAADLLVFSDLLSTCGTSKPFYIDEPFTGNDAIWMKLTADSRQVQDPAIPAATDAPQKRIELSMLEHLA